jgi:hypothetical protein
MKAIPIPERKKDSMTTITTTSSISTKDIQLLRNAMLFTLTTHSWGNRASASKGAVQSDADEDRVTASFQLLGTKKNPCAEYKAVMAELGALYNWCLSHSMLSGMRKGLYFAKRYVTDPENPSQKVSQIDQFDAKIAESERRIRKVLIPAFLDEIGEDGLTAYERGKNAARLPKEQGGLGSNYREDYYPSVAELRNSFRIDYQWLQLSVPDELPQEIRERENAKLRRSYEEAQTEIKFALRESFLSMLKGAADQLTVGPDGKEKAFKQNLFDDRWQNFFATFESKNMLEDAELEALVTQCKAILSGVSGQEMKDDVGIRERVAEEFGKVQEAVTELVAEKPVRKFAFEE